MREMTPAEKAGIVKGKRYVVTGGNNYFSSMNYKGPVYIIVDDGSHTPWFGKSQDGRPYAVNIYYIKPYEGDDMEMPKLEAGMVVELESEGDVYGPYLVITENWFISFNGCGWLCLTNGVEVTKIWGKQERRALKYVEKYLDDPIWERESTEERHNREQREELQKKLEDAQALVAEVQGEIAKL